MITLYSSHCPKCVMIERMLNASSIPFEVCDNPDIYLPLAEKHGIASMPFAKIDGRVFPSKELQSWIQQGGCAV